MSKIAMGFIAHVHHFIEQRVFGTHEQGIAVRFGTGYIVQCNRADRACHVLREDGTAQCVFGRWRDGTLPRLRLTRM